MPPRKRKAGPIPVESFVHVDRRINLPTVDAQEFVTPEVEERRQLVLARDTALDPQLVWRGKYDDELSNPVDDATALAADAPPIYIQEKFDPEAMIADLRRSAWEGVEPIEPTLFDAFDDDLGELDRLEFYKHPTVWSNRIILGDSLQVMSSLVEREELRGHVQMVYVDPPYGIRFGSNWQASTGKRDVKDGKIEDAAREAEQIKAFRDTWELGIHSYLSYLRDRLLVARELLTESGSCFVQIGDENVHLVRALMDEVFGRESFVSQISFAKTTGQESLQLANVTDYLLWYGKVAGATKVRQLLRPKVVGGFGAKEYRRVDLADGSMRSATAGELTGEVALPVDARLFTTGDMTSDGGTAADIRLPDGRVLRGKAGVHWKTTLDGMIRLWHAGRVMPSGGYRIYKRYLDDFPVVGSTNLWPDVRSESDRAYVVQTAASVVERCLLMSTDPGDLILDPTCGSGTAAYVAEQWGRRWITVDTSRVALALAKQRLMAAKYPYYVLADSERGRAAEAKATGKAVPPAPTDNDLRRGFVYERVQHITLKSIANNPDIIEGMTRDEIDAAIRRHAEFELLYDKPYEDKGVVRVTGPFTVESLSPHRSLAFASDDVAHAESISERSGAAQPDAPTFEQSILENLQRAGVQNGRKSERIEFASVEPYPGTYIQAIGVTDDGSRVGVAIGPQYGTVDQRFARDAVREAIRATDLDLLCLLGFAFDAATADVTEADGVTVDTSSEGFASVTGERSFGRIKLLFVRMNVDLLMGEDLKKTRAANLFTVFGEPDIEARALENDELQVELHGVDIFDPTTGEVRSNDTSQIALWMIDSDYTGDSFVVRHCYFTGSDQPYKKLRDTLQTEIDAEAWASLNRTVSRPFPRPKTGRIAVKVINDYGDEVMKVFEVDAVG